MGPKAEKLLGAVLTRQRVGRDGHAMLGKLAIPRRHLAFRTDAAPAANGIEIDAKLTCSRQNRCAQGKPSAFSGRCEDDECRFAHICGLPIGREHNVLFRRGKPVKRGLFLTHEAALA